MHDQPFTVLLVDDNEVNREMLAVYLEHEGYRVVTARDGLEALGTIRKEPVDLVLLDVVMPGPSGLDVLKAVRQRHGPDDLPIIMATAMDESEDVVKAFDLGANDYVTKPLDFPVVLVRIQAQLRSRVPGEGLRSKPTSEMPSFFEAIKPGTVLDGRFRLESLIGSGSVGAVYRTIDLQLHRPVAVKLLHTGFRAGDEPLARFRQESISACRIQHPNAVSVLDFSVTSGGVPFLVMELLEGHTLGDELKREGRLGPERCAEILFPICAVLSEAHAVGIIHRDIKPQNIFLHQSRMGEVVKVVDFGIAKLVGESALNQNITLDGGAPGTPAYMAPERFTNEDYDGRADVYSVGVMLHEMLIGTAPFVVEDGNPIKMVLMHRGEPPPPLRSFDPDLPEALEALVLQTLEKDFRKRPKIDQLADRFASAIGLDRSALAFLNAPPPVS